MILMRETTPATMRCGTVVEIDSTPSMRKRTRRARPSGSKWMSEAPRSAACAMIELTSLTTGASSADSRRSTTSPSSSSAARPAPRPPRAPSRRSGPGARSAPRCPPPSRPPAARRSASASRGRRPPARSPDRPSRRAACVVAEGDGNRLVALRRGRVDQVRRRHVDLEHGQVEMVESVALGDGARELVLGDDALLDQHAARAAPDARAISTAASTRSRVAKPSSTSTSPRKRPRRPRWVGDVTPFQSSCGAAASEPSATGTGGLSLGSGCKGTRGALPRLRLVASGGVVQAARRRRAARSARVGVHRRPLGRQGGGRARASRRGRRSPTRSTAAALRLADRRVVDARAGAGSRRSPRAAAPRTSRGAGRPVQRRKLRAPCRTRIVKSVHHLDAGRARGEDELGRMRRVCEVDDAWVSAEVIGVERQRLERIVASVQAD